MRIIITGDTDEEVEKALQALEVMGFAEAATARWESPRTAIITTSRQRVEPILAALRVISRRVGTPG